MPELPEVETVKRRLTPSIKNKKITDVNVFYSKYNHLNDIKDEVILEINRKGKFLIFTLSNHMMVSHLRMEGKYRIEKNPIKDKHDLVFFNLDDGNTLVYNDTRKFGVFNLFPKDTDVFKEEPLINVGPEPFYLTKEELLESLKGKSTHIKTALLDQSIISGLGNIYVDEVLFMSRVNPFRKASSVTPDEAEQIIKNSITVLNNAINAGGTTIRSFKSFNGESGHFQGNLLVHEREYERCPVCGNIIFKEKCNGRGTYLCKSCERLFDYKMYAITGTFASGKSTVLDIISELGYKTYSLDKIYQGLFSNDEKMKKEIFKNFKTLDRAELRDLVYNDFNKNNLLKTITHKYIFKELFNQIEKNQDSIIFVEVPLLFDDGYEKVFDKVIDVYVSEDIEKIVLKNKNISSLTKAQTDSNQLSKEDKMKKSDYVINNTSTLNHLKEETIKVLKELGVWDSSKQQ